MSSRTRTAAVRVAALLALGLGGLAVAGCGGNQGASADVAAGKTTFSNLCSSCHTLADSGKPPATVGPNLDDAFRASRQVGISEDQFAGVVRRWISIAQMPMPRNLVKGKDADNVAAYVASVAGRSPDSAVIAAPPWPNAKPVPPRQEPAR